MNIPRSLTATALTIFVVVTPATTVAQVSRVAAAPAAGSYTEVVNQSRASADCQGFCRNVG